MGKVVVWRREKWQARGGEGKAVAYGRIVRDVSSSGR